jgi:hypothetical protein
MRWKYTSTVWQFFMAWQFYPFLYWRLLSLKECHKWKWILRTTNRIAKIQQIEVRKCLCEKVVGRNMNFVSPRLLNGRQFSSVFGVYIRSSWGPWNCAIHFRKGENTFKAIFAKWKQQNGDGIKEVRGLYNLISIPVTD